MNDPMGKAYLENQRVGHDYIEFVNWPANYDRLKIAALKYHWHSLLIKYGRMMRLGEEVVKLLEEG